MLDSAIRSLKEHRLFLVGKLEKVDAAINALDSIDDRQKSTPEPVSIEKKPARRVMSASARRRISLAQKARWARFRKAA